MVVTSHGSTSSSTLSQDHQSLDNYDLDMANGGIHNPNDSEYQVHVAFQIQPKSEYEYGADTSDEKTPFSNISLSTKTTIPAIRTWWILLVVALFLLLSLVMIIMFIPMHTLHLLPLLFQH
ncbi:unnamed protein product [Absidia cylindrospora]